MLCPKCPFPIIMERNSYRSGVGCGTGSGTYYLAPPQTVNRCPVCGHTVVESVEE